MNLTDIKRWIKASIIQELKNKTGGVYLFVEGDTRPTDKPTHFELRVDGPNSKPLAGGQFKFKIEVNILINNTRDESNIYSNDNLHGIASEMLNRNFCIKKIGNVNSNPVDDGSYFGMMQLIPMDEIKVADFGQIDPNTEVYQAVSEAHYEMYV